jgi:hypothetical protein
MKNSLRIMTVPILMLFTAHATAQEVQFRRWTDPREGAFNLEVPVGWTVQGGTFRPYAGTGAITDVMLVSPDQRVRVRFGDANLPVTFVEMNQTLASLGYQEGSRPSTSSMILGYKTGMDFAAIYVRQMMNGRCDRLGWTRKGNYPDYVRQQNQRVAQAGIRMFSAYTAGDLSFRCETAQTVLVGYQFAETYATSYAGTATAWAIRQTYGFVTTPDRAALANTVMARALATMRINPQWFYGEVGHQQRLLTMQQRYTAYTATLMQVTYQVRQISLDRRARWRGSLL